MNPDKFLQRRDHTLRLAPCKIMAKLYEDRLRLKDDIVAVIKQEIRDDS